MDKLEVRIALQLAKVAFASERKVVDRDHPMTEFNQCVAEVAADEAGAASDENLHLAFSSSFTAGVPPVCDVLGNYVHHGLMSVFNDTVVADGHMDRHVGDLTQRPALETGKAGD